MEAVYELGDFKLQSGVVLPAAKLAYEAHGNLNDIRDNVIVSWASGRHADHVPFVQEEMELDSSEYFILVEVRFSHRLHY